MLSSSLPDVYWNDFVALFSDWITFYISSLFQKFDLNSIDKNPQKPQFPGKLVDLIQIPPAVRKAAR
jgi:hypothetical protein